MNHTANVLAFSFSRGDQLAFSAKEILQSAGVLTIAVSEVVLQDCGYAGCPQTCIRAIYDTRPDLLLVCLPQQREDRAKAVVQAARDMSPDLPILVAAHGSTPEAIYDFIAAGAQDFLVAPLRPADLLPRVWRLRAGSSHALDVEFTLKERLALKTFVGQSPAILAAIKRIPSVAQCSASVLILGETGSGKEVCARAIHYLSSRSEKPFMPLNCGAIPLELVENHLFGHDQGAFTGANTASAGLLRACDGGTLFLDEVDCLPLLAQVKLLRFLQEREFQPLGSTKTCSADVRIIAASNSDLEEAVRSRRFRQDLYYRLNVVPIELPPLRKRIEDIPLLARHFLHKYADNFHRTPKTLSPGALQRLMAYNWPGNVRELENIVERAVLLSTGPLVSSDDVQLPVPWEDKGALSFKALKAKTVIDFERTYIRQVLDAHDGNIAKAAAAAKKHRRAFFQLMRKHDIKANKPSLNQ